MLNRRTKLTKAFLQGLTISVVFTVAETVKPLRQEAPSYREHKRQTTCGVNDVILVTLAGHRTQRLQTRTLRLSLGAMSA